MVGPQVNLDERCSCGHHRSVHIGGGCRFVIGIGKQCPCGGFQAQLPPTLLSDLAVTFEDLVMLVWKEEDRWRFEDRLDAQLRRVSLD